MPVTTKLVLLGAVLLGGKWAYDNFVAPTRSLPAPPAAPERFSEVVPVSGVVEPDPPMITFRNVAVPPRA